MKFEASLDPTQHTQEKLLSSFVRSDNQKVCVLGSATTSRDDLNSRSCSRALDMAGSLWLPWLCHPSPWVAPFKGLPGPASTGTIHQTCLPPVRRVLNSSGKGLGSTKCCQAGPWMALYVPNAARITPNGKSWFQLPCPWGQPQQILFSQSHKEQFFFPQTCNCPSRSFPYLVGWFLGFLASHGYLA